MSAVDESLAMADWLAPIRADQGIALLGPLCAPPCAPDAADVRGCPPPAVLVGVRPEVAELGCLFTDGALCLEAEVLFYTPAQCPPREACAGRRLVCVPHYPRTAQGAIDLEALRTLPLRELAGRPPPATLSAAPCNPKCRPLQP